MSTQISVIGLNQVGASIGLALSAYKDKLVRVGHDANASRMKKVLNESAFDKTIASLTEAVRNAKLVILTLPTDLQRDALRLIANAINPDTVVVCISHVSTTPLAWARETLSAQQPFIILLPILPPDRLRDWEDSLEVAQPGFFTNCDMLVVTDHDTQTRAFQMANDLCQLLGAKPYFSEPLEADGIIARVEQLPKLSAAALLSTLVGQPGWDDSRRLTSRAFFRTASISSLYDEEEFFGLSSLMNKENIIRAIDDYISSMMELRDLIEQDDEDGLKQVLLEARKGFELWLAQRTSGDWEKKENSPPELERNMMSRLFGVKPRIKKTDQ